METLRVKLAGIAPLMMHSGRLADPFDPDTKALKAVTAKRKKTEEDMLDIYRLEWMGGLYYDPGAGPFIPGANLDTMVAEAARLQKRGKDVARGFMTLEDRLPLTYEGPRDRAAMFASGRFTDVRGVKNPGTGKRVMRCRPIFREWSLEATLSYDEKVLDEADVRAFLRDGGQYIGLGDYRPGSPRGGRYGRFEATVAQGR